MLTRFGPLLVVVALLSAVQLAAESGWEPYEETDPFTDIVRKGVRLGNVSIWCAKEHRLDKKRLHGAIFTTELPEERCSYNQFVGTTCQVLVEFRFDEEKRRRGQFNRLEDGEGVAMQNPGLRHTAKAFARNMLKATALTYRVDTHDGGELVTLDLENGKKNT
jgi:hypothetical protein